MAPCDLLTCMHEARPECTNQCVQRSNQCYATLPPYVLMGGIIYWWGAAPIVRKSGICQMWLIIGNVSHTGTINVLILTCPTIAHTGGGIKSRIRCYYTTSCTVVLSAFVEKIAIGSNRFIRRTHAMACTPPNWLPRTDVRVQLGIIGASVSESHTSQLNGGISLIGRERAPH